MSHVRFRLFVNERRVRLWRHRGQTLDVTQARLEGGGGSVHVWASIWHDGRAPVFSCWAVTSMASITASFWRTSCMGIVFLLAPGNFNNMTMLDPACSPCPRGWRFFWGQTSQFFHGHQDHLISIPSNMLGTTLVDESDSTKPTTLIQLTRLLIAERTNFEHLDWEHSQAHWSCNWKQRRSNEILNAPITFLPFPRTLKPALLRATASYGHF